MVTKFSWYAHNDRTSHQLMLEVFYITVNSSIYNVLVKKTALEINQSLFQLSMLLMAV